MGLDMYLYKVSKPKVDVTQIFDVDELHNMHISVFGDDETLPCTILDKSIKLKVRRKHVNVAKMAKDHGYSEEARISLSMQSCEKVCYNVYDGDRKGQIELTYQQVEENYLYDVISKNKVCVMEEIDYQRKGLNDDGWNLLPENCEYSDDKENIQKMTEVGGLSSTFIENWIDNETVFLAWW